MLSGIHYVNFTLPGGSAAVAPTLAGTARVAEDAGCDVFTVMDHYFQMEHFATSQDPMLEGYTALGYLAGITEKMRLGLLVTGVTYRYPGLLAKIVTTLNVLSNGRGFLGIGAAWYEREHVGLGVPYPPTAERFERLEETLQICQQMWSDNEGPYNGKHYQLAETINQPPAVSRPRILIGGSGEKKTLRLVAQYADACNLFATTPEEVKRKLDILKQHCDDVGTDYDAIQKTMLRGGDPLGDPDGYLRNMEAYAAIGIQLVQHVPETQDPPAEIAKLAEYVLPRLHEIG